jgi:hypothetical protein
VHRIRKPLLYPAELRDRVADAIAWGVVQIEPAYSLPQGGANYIARCKRCQRTRSAAAAISD